MDNGVGNKIKKNQVDDFLDNTLKFYSNYIIDIPIRYPQPVVTILLRGDRNSINMVTFVLTCLWDIGSSNITIKIKN